MLELKNVSKFYNSNGVVTLGLRNINLSFNKGEIVAITGESGSGKSTLLNVMTGVDTYEDGEILFYGNETSYFDGNDMDAFRKNNVSFIYQKYNIIDSYTVLENVMIPFILKGSSIKEAKNKALELIDRVGLSKRAKHKGSKLSGGEKQRCVIARALASDSPILACDEPTGNLDSKTGDNIISLIKEVSKDKLVFIVTHNFKQVSDIATRKITLRDGEVIEDFIIKENSKVDEPLKMDLDYKRASLKNDLYFATKNILSTPKKSFLSGMIFFFIALITLGLTILTMTMSEAKTSSIDFINLSKDRVIILNDDHEKLDLNKLKGLDIDEIYENAFYEDNIQNIDLGRSSEFSITLSSLINHKINMDMIFGNMPANDNELIYCIPSDYITEDEGEYINKEVFINLGKNPSNVKQYSLGTIVGVAKSDEINQSVLIPYGKFNESIINITYLNSISFFYENDGAYKRFKEVLDKDIEKTTISIPKDADKNSIVCALNYMYKCDIDYSITYNDYNEYSISYGKDYYDNMLEVKLDTYEASLYSNNTSKLKGQLERLGFSVIEPTKIPTSDGLNLADFYFYLFITIIALVAMYYISYAILSHVYISKTNDYGVLRALGVMRSDLGLIIKIESILQALVGAILASILLLILKYTTSLSSDLAHLNIGLVAIVSVVMVMLGALIGSRFNRRLFKASLNTTLKDGENND